MMKRKEEKPKYEIPIDPRYSTIYVRPAQVLNRELKKKIHCKRVHIKVCKNN